MRFQSINEIEKFSFDDCEIQKLEVFVVVESIFLFIV